MITLFPRTARRENRCPLTPLAHFYTSDRHENWWVYRFKVAEHDAGDSKSNGSLVLPQFAKYGPIPPKISAITTSKVSTEVNSSVEPRVGLQIHLGITEDQSSGPLVSKIPLFTHPSPIVSKGGVYITTHDVHVHIWCTLQCVLALSLCQFYHGSCVLPAKKKLTWILISITPDLGP